MTLDVAQFHRTRTTRNRYGALKHGAVIGGTRSKEHRAWTAMKQRCLNQRDAKFGLYGARGITVCPRWRESFAAFLQDMGPCPAGKSLDRINNDGNYEPGNCRWASTVEQANNTRHCRSLTLNGETMTAAQWARRLGWNPNTIRARLFLGWDDQRTLTTPVKLRRGA